MSPTLTEMWDLFMLNMLWAGMMSAGIFWAAFHGNMGEVTNGLLDSAKEAVTLGVTMLGIMSFWCGILKIGERAGLIEALTEKMRPVIRFLFPNLPDGHPAGRYIATNMIANMLGSAGRRHRLGKGDGRAGKAGGRATGRKKRRIRGKTRQGRAVWRDSRHCQQ